MKSNLILLCLVAVLAKTDEENFKTDTTSTLVTKVAALESNLREQNEQLHKSQEKEERYLQKIKQYAEYISNESVISQQLLNTLDEMPRIDLTFIVHQLLDKLEKTSNLNDKLK